jgi:cytoskeleton protein RodZ
MTVTATTSISVLEPKVTSVEGFHSILAQIESELLNSEVYNWTLTGLQKILGETAAKAEVLLKSVAREAIRLAFSEFTHKFQEPKQETKIKKSYQEKSIPLPPPIPISPACKSDNISPVNYDSTLPIIEESVDETKPEVKPKKNNLLPKIPKIKKISKAEKEALLAEENANKWQEICQLLKKERQARALSLYQLHKQTMIPLHHLQALDNGKIESLPAEVYVRGFIRRLADTLGLNGTEIMHSLPSYDPLPTVYAVPGNANINTNVDKINPIHLYLGYTALMAGAVTGVSWLAQKNTVPVGFIPDNLDDGKVYSSPKIEKNPHQKTPGIASGHVAVGVDLAAPEMLYSGIQSQDIEIRG